MFDIRKKWWSKLNGSRSVPAVEPAVIEPVLTAAMNDVAEPVSLPEVVTPEASAPVSAPLPTEPVSLPKHAGGRPSVEFNRGEAAMLKLQGWSYREIARKFDVSKSFVHRAIHDWMPKTEVVAPASEKDDPKDDPSTVESTTGQQEPASRQQEPTERRTLPSILRDAWDSLIQPGPSAVLPERPVIESPVVKAEPVAVAPEPVPPEPDPDERPIDPVEEARIDLPTRTPGRIRFLLRFESPEQTKIRIANDFARVVYERAGGSVANPQEAIIGDRQYGNTVTFVKR